MEKIGPKFSQLLTVRAEKADPFTPLTVSLTVKRPFFTTSHLPIVFALQVPVGMW